MAVALEELRRHADELTEQTGIHVHISQEGAQVYVILDSLPLPARTYLVGNTDVLFITDTMYPLSAMDMFWTDPAVVRRDGAIPAGAESIETYGGRRLLAADPLFPTGDAWEAQQRDQLRPSARWISSAVSKAITEHAGLLFVHSHPDPGHPIGFSPTDRSSISSLAQTIAPMLEGPFAAAVVHPEGWAASLVEHGEFVPVERIVSVGRTLRLLSPLQPVP